MKTYLLEFQTKEEAEQAKAFLSLSPVSCFEPVQSDAKYLLPINIEDWEITELVILGKNLEGNYRAKKNLDGNYRANLM